MVHDTRGRANWRERYDDMAGKVLPDNLIEQLKRKGLTDVQVVDYLREHENVSVIRQAISAWRKRRGDDVRPQSPRAIPFDLKPEHRMMEAARVLRWHAKLARGEWISDEDRARYQRAMDFLGDDKVFLYDPDSEEGWFTTPRRPDDAGILRLW